MGNSGTNPISRVWRFGPPPYGGKQIWVFDRVLDDLDPKVEGFKPSQWEISLSPTQFQGLEVWTPPMRRKTNLIFYPVLDGLGPQLEGFKPPSGKFWAQPNFRVWRLGPPPYGGKQISISTGFWTVSTPNWFKPFSGKFGAQPNFRGLKVWTRPYRTEENKFQFCTGFWTVWTRNWKGLNRPSGKYWAQPNFRGLRFGWVRVECSTVKATMVIDSYPINFQSYPS